MIKQYNKVKHHPVSVNKYELNFPPEGLVSVLRDCRGWRYLGPFRKAVLVLWDLRYAMHCTVVCCNGCHIHL